MVVIASGAHLSVALSLLTVLVPLLAGCAGATSSTALVAVVWCEDASLKTAGTYGVTLTVTDAAGNTGNATTRITVHEKATTAPSFLPGFDANFVLAAIAIIAIGMAAARSLKGNRAQR